MSAFGMHPTFNDAASYRAWRATWRRLHKTLSAKIRQEKLDLKTKQRTAPADERTHSAQRKLHFNRVMGHKLMTLLKDAKIRWQRILSMQAQIAEQNAGFPLDLGRCPVVDFHYNKGASEFPAILPMWILKAKGKTFYLNHVDFSGVSFSTRELAEGSTKGMLRFRHCHVNIEADGTAAIRQAQAQSQAA